MARLQLVIPDDMLAQWKQEHLITMQEHEILAFGAWIRAMVEFARKVRNDPDFSIEENQPS